MNDETSFSETSANWIVALIILISITLMFITFISFKDVYLDANQKTIQNSNESILEDD